jgi:hypothetical protein
MIISIAMTTVFLIAFDIDHTEPHKPIVVIICIIH